MGIPEFATRIYYIGGRRHAIRLSRLHRRLQIEENAGGRHRLVQRMEVGI
jgi:hypothetical protein